MFAYALSYLYATIAYFTLVNFVVNPMLIYIYIIIYMFLVLNFNIWIY